MGERSFSENIFRQEVQDDIIFDIDTELRGGARSPSEVIAQERKAKPRTDKFDVSGLLGALSGIKAPDLSGINLGIDLSGIKVPPIDFKTPEIPRVNIEGPQINLEPAITAVGGVLGRGAELTGEVVGAVAKPIGAAAEVSGEVIGSIAKPITEVIGSVAKPVGQAIQSVASGLEDLKIKQGSGDEFGEIKMGDTGAVIDLSSQIEETISEITKDSAISGVKGKDVFDLAVNPNKFIKNKGREFSANAISESLGIESGFAKDIVDALDNPDAFIKKKGAKKAADFVVQASGLNAGKGIAEKIGGAGVSAGVISGVSELIESGDVGKAAESAIKGAATATAIRGISTLANIVLPGSGFVIEAASAIFGYSCYLSTAAYHHGWITKKEFLAFTHYRIKIQSKETLSTQIWLGYIMFFEPKYKTMIHNKKKSKIIYQLITKPWLIHIQYLLGKGRFNLRGFIMTQILKGICLGSYLLNYKKTKKTKKKLRNLNILNVYRVLIKIIERKPAYGT